MTRSLQIESLVGKDGVLLVRVPLAPSDADTDVIITIQPKPAHHSCPPGYFEQTYGCMADDLMAIPDDPIPVEQVTSST